ncbi:MAG: class I SAM-dependent methyltransferase [Candidatus Sericytochromatia bacterium]|nr:class I SAM-dependent methyltransferase [Candidatus Sericytochromatia bacterium]
MSTRTLRMTDALYAYLTGPISRETDLLRQLREETSRMPESMMQISPEQGQFLTILLKLMGARKALEIGVFTGYSSLVTALALPEDGLLVALDVSEEYTAIARKYWELANVSQRIDLRIAPALDSLEELLQAGASNSFDFIFIDADKSHYDAYYEQALCLLRPGGLVAIDNTLWSGRVLESDSPEQDTQAIMSLNVKMQADERIEFCLLPIGDGLSLAVKRPTEGR